MVEVGIFIKFFEFNIYIYNNGDWVVIEDPNCGKSLLLNVKISPNLDRLYLGRPYLKLRFMVGGPKKKLKATLADQYIRL